MAFNYFRSGQFSLPLAPLVFRKQIMSSRCCAAMCGKGLVLLFHLKGVNLLFHVEIERGGGGIFISFGYGTPGASDVPCYFWSCYWNKVRTIRLFGVAGNGEGVCFRGCVFYDSKCEIAKFS